MKRCCGCWRQWMAGCGCGKAPNLLEELLNAIISSMEANGSVSRQALNSEAIQAGLLSVLLGPGALWERLRRGEEGGEGAR